MDDQEKRRNDHQALGIHEYSPLYNNLLYDFSSDEFRFLFQFP